MCSSNLNSFCLNLTAEMIIIEVAHPQIVNQAGSWNVIWQIRTLVFLLHAKSEAFVENYVIKGYEAFMANYVIKGYEIFMANYVILKGVHRKGYKP